MLARLNEGVNEDACTPDWKRVPTILIEKESGMIPLTFSSTESVEIQEVEGYTIWAFSADTAAMRRESVALISLGRSESAKCAARHVHLIRQPYDGRVLHQVRRSIARVEGSQLGKNQPALRLFDCCRQVSEQA